MLLMLYTLIVLMVSALLTTALVVLIGDVVERRRDPRRGLPTCRRIRRDAHAALDRCGQVLHRGSTNPADK